MFSCASCMYMFCTESTLIRSELVTYSQTTGAIQRVVGRIPCFLSASPRRRAIFLCPSACGWTLLPIPGSSQQVNLPWKEHDVLRKDVVECHPACSVDNVDVLVSCRFPASKQPSVNRHSIWLHHNEPLLDDFLISSWVVVVVWRPIALRPAPWRKNVCGSLWVDLANAGQELCVRLRCNVSTICVPLVCVSTGTTNINECLPCNVVRVVVGSDLDEDVSRLLALLAEVPWRGVIVIRRVVVAGVFCLRCAADKQGQGRSGYILTLKNMPEMPP